MANPGVSMNIGVFKELNDQLTAVTEGTEIFRTKISTLVRDLQGLTQVVSSLPAGLNNLNKQMVNTNITGGSSNLNAASVVSHFQPNQSSNVFVDNKAVQDAAKARQNFTNNLQPLDITNRAATDWSKFAQSSTLRNDFKAAGDTSFGFDVIRPVDNQRRITVPKWIENLRREDDNKQNIAANVYPVQQFPEVRVSGSTEPTPKTNLNPTTQQAYSELRQQQFRDIVGVSKLGKEQPLEKTGEQIDKLTASLNKIDSTIAKVLSKELNDLKEKFSVNSDMFNEYTKALGAYEKEIVKSGPDSNESKKLFGSLNEATRKIDIAASKLADVSIAATQLEGVSKPSTWRGATIKALGAGAFAADTVATVARQGFDFYKEMEARDITSARETMTGRGALAQKQWGAFGEQFDLYNARNLMRWGGDLVTPGLTKFAGTEGYAKAKNEAFNELAREQQLKETEAKTGLGAGSLETGGNLLGTFAKILAAPAVSAAITGFATKAVAGAALGSAFPGLGTLGGGIAGGAVGLYMVGDAIRDTITNANKVATQYQAAPSFELYGGRADSLYGKMSNFMFGTQDNIQDIKERTKARVAVEQANQLQDRTRALQDAEIDRLPHIEQALQKFQDVKRTRYQAMSQLGAFAGLPVAALDMASQNQLKGIFNPDDPLEQLDFNNANRKKFDINTFTYEKNQKANADTKMVADQKISDVIDRSMQRDEKGNFKDPSMRFANLGLGTSEVQQRAYQYQMALGVGQMKTTEQVMGGDKTFDRINRMSLAGLGSFEQLAGNVTALSQITGGSTAKNEQQLETIFAKGVAAGFNNSRLSQSLLQTTTDIAASLNLRNVAGVATSVLDAAKAVGGGTIDERGMRDAAASIQKYAQFTGQKEGPMGMLKMATALRSGFTPQAGLDIAMDMTAAQATDMRQRILEAGGVKRAKGDTSEDILRKNIEAAKKIIEKDPSKISDPRLRDLLGQDTASVQRLLTDIPKVSENILSNLWKQKGAEGTFEDARAKFIKDMDDASSDKDKAKVRERFRRQISDTLGDAGKRELDAGLLAQIESETVAGQKQLGQKSVDTRKAEALVDEERKTQADFKTTMTKLGKQFATRTLNADQYAQALSSGKMTTTIDGQQYTGEQLTKKLAEGDRGFREKVEEKSKEETVSSMAARRTSSSMELGAAPTVTNIANIEQTAANTLAAAIAREMKSNQNIPLVPIKSPIHSTSGAQ